MKTKLKLLSLLASVSFASSAGAVIVPLEFNSISMQTGSSTIYSTAGDIWVASNVRADGGQAMDAIFTITGVSGASSSNVAFVNEPARGNNMRVRVGGTSPVGNVSVFITISFVNHGTSTPYTGWSLDEELITQFSDLDSDAGADRSDFAGARTTQFKNIATSDSVNPGSSLLETFNSPSYASGYTVAIMEDPWSLQENVTDTSDVAQSPVTAAFLFDYRNSLDVVVGQRTNGPNANRHIDIDMTPDFVIIPEPSTALLAGIMGMLMIIRRRRA